MRSKLLVFVGGLEAEKALIHRSRRGCGPDVSRHRRRPWLKITDKYALFEVDSQKSNPKILTGDGLALGVLAVGDGVTDDVLEEDLQDTASLFVDQARDTLDATTASQTADSRLGDALDVVTKDLKLR